MPFIASASVLVYQWLTHRDFWKSLTSDSSDDLAGAIMAIGELTQLFTYIGAASLIGFVLAWIVIFRRKRFGGIGFVGLIVNGIPLAVVSFWYLRVLARGAY